MKKQEVRKSPEFLAYVLKLNGDIELSKALQISLNRINELEHCSIESNWFKNLQKR